MTAEPAAARDRGPKYYLNIEGRGMVPWDHESITTSQIAELGGWDMSQGVVEVNEDGDERTLSPDETVQLKPGMGFGKKHRWKRG